MEHNKRNLSLNISRMHPKYHLWDNKDGKQAKLLPKTNNEDEQYMWERSEADQQKLFAKTKTEGFTRNGSPMGKGRMPKTTTEKKEALIDAM